MLNLADLAGEGAWQRRQRPRPLSEGNFRLPTLATRCARARRIAPTPAVTLPSSLPHASPRLFVSALPHSLRGLSRQGCPAHVRLPVQVASLPPAGTDPAAEVEPTAPPSWFCSWVSEPRRVRRAPS